MHQPANASYAYSPPHWKRPAVLLIDADAKRQFERAAGMRGRGVAVDCADNGAAAYTLWDPKAYQLVLIDFVGADDAIRAFCRHVQELSPLQNMGFYRAAPPFIVRSQAAAEVPVPDQLSQPSRDRLQVALAEATQPGTAHFGIKEAAERIAVLRRRPRAHPTPEIRPEPRPQPRPQLPPAESDASIAARVLGGNLEKPVA